MIKIDGDMEIKERRASSSEVELSFKEIYVAW